MSTDTWEVLLPGTIDPVGPESIDDIASFTRIDEYTDRAALLADIGRFDAIVVRVADLTAELLQEASSLEVIAKHGAGLDNVDVEPGQQCRQFAGDVPEPERSDRVAGEFAVGEPVSLPSAVPDVRVG